MIGYNYQPIVSRVNTFTEFYDPDTVEMINFLNKETPKTSVFTATMQVCAMIKLGTGRAITNHPHYENEWLRKRTRNAYQIYSKLPANQIHSILKSMGTTHIVLESSVCFQRGKDPQCKTKGVIDLHNGHMPDNLPKEIEASNPGLIKMRTKRMCEELIGGPNTYHKKLFRLVFQNKTFSIFRLL